MAERLAHRDLRNRSSEILRNVAAGATYEITNHGEVVAILSPAPGHGSLRIRPATKSRRFSALPRVRLASPAQDALDELRADR
ncbi:MAG: type II toxin-antitoxin system Phd/YefM family antitoxin [Actinomycetes bacterium]